MIDARELNVMVKYLQNFQKILVYSVFENCNAFGYADDIKVLLLVGSKLKIKDKQISVFINDTQIQQSSSI